MRPKQLRFLVSVGAAFALTLGASACGDSDDSGDGGGDAAEATGIPEEFVAVTAAPEDAQEGGDLVVLSEGDIDYMDPGAAVLPGVLHGHAGDATRPRGVGTR